MVIRNNYSTSQIQTTPYSIAHFFSHHRFDAILMWDVIISLFRSHSNIYSPFFFFFSYRNIVWHRRRLFVCCIILYISNLKCAMCAGPDHERIPKIRPVDFLLRKFCGFFSTCAIFPFSVYSLSSLVCTHFRHSHMHF